ncbi:hypothetical protein EIKCOROL_01822 [Eikenella corrodens ATCC 23834]|uniref:Uncharacterized protein n=1 Tax=Eikenella corrodens ATCC 23834 TaxID=546274 RepID=C0DWR9_EIKCO|nr:hypothetical protein EIKCOROL_01822 [Eikenella corrodens ATCC 23834]
MRFSGRLKQQAHSVYTQLPHQQHFASWAVWLGFQADRLPENSTKQPASPLI